MQSLEDRDLEGGVGSLPQRGGSPLHPVLTRSRKAIFLTGGTSMQFRAKTTSPQTQPVLLPPEAAIALFNRLLILDVQNPRYATNVIPGAHRLNVDISLRNIAKDQSILLTCLCGQRSLAAAQQVVRRGYRSVYVLKGGVLAWRQAGQTIQRIKVSA